MSDTTNATPRRTLTGIAAELEEALADLAVQQAEATAWQKAVKPLLLRREAAADRVWKLRDAMQELSQPERTWE